MPHRIFRPGAQFVQVGAAVLFGQAALQLDRGETLAIGEQALLMTRIEAGLPLINVEFSSSRYAFTDHDRVTPKEAGLQVAGTPA